jgi:nitrite reductase/ring-hydroxylating ferredoxin subunit
MRDPATGGVWVRAIDTARLQERGRAVIKLDGKQLALFAVGGRVYACNNRCPHEGYPLVEGHVAGTAGECVLTCNWHNWKFVLEDGSNVYGGDALRTYPVRIDDGAVWVDVAEAPQAQRIQGAYARLRQAMKDNQYDRIAREIARLGKSGADPRDAVAQAIAASHTRLRDGFTHAYAAASAWLRLYDETADPAERLTCLAEAVGHIAFDTLREEERPYGDGSSLHWDAPGFLAAVEAQDEDRALAFVRGAVADDIGFAGIEHTLATAALAHYNDFGHALIYLNACGDLIDRFGNEVELPLLLAYVRALVRATREDLIPDFRKYAGALAAWRTAAATNDAAEDAISVRATLDPSAWVGTSIGRALETTIARRTAPPLDLHRALLGAGAIHLLRFDATHEQRTDVTVADNIGWLDFTHAITFAHAVRLTCTRFPGLWPEALLQMALFVGRNSAYLGERAVDARSVELAEFDAIGRSRVLNHGVGLYIHSAHLLKTWLAARDEIVAGLPPAVAGSVSAAVIRYLSARVHQKRPLRSARQALDFVDLED